MTVEAVTSGIMCSCLFLVPVGAFASYLGFHLGGTGAVQARDVRLLFGLGLDFRLFLGALLMALEDDAAGHGFFYFLIHSEILFLEGVKRT